MRGLVRAAAFGGALLVGTAAAAGPVGAQAPAITTTAPPATMSTSPVFVPPEGAPETTPTTMAPLRPDDDQGRVLPIFVLLSIGGFALALLIMVAQFVATRPRRPRPRLMSPHDSRRDTPGRGRRGRHGRPPPPG